MLQANVYHCHTGEHWKHCESHVFDFSRAFNTIQPAILRGKLEGAGVDRQLAAWTINYLTNRTQYVRLQEWLSEVVMCSSGSPQGTVLCSFLFTLYKTPLIVISRSSQTIEPSLDVYPRGTIWSTEGSSQTSSIIRYELNHLLHWWTFRA